MGPGFAYPFVLIVEYIVDKIYQTPLREKVHAALFFVNLFTGLAPSIFTVFYFPTCRELTVWTLIATFPLFPLGVALQLYIEKRVGGW
jgi:hypothetical protein